MAWKATRVVVGTSATVLTTGDEGHQMASSVAVTNLSTTETVWIGGPDVTVEAGYPLLPGAEIAGEPENRRDLPFAIAAVEGVQVAVLRTGLGL
jgi:hypothetical protein